MKNTRKWIAAIMAVLMLVLMAACGNKSCNMRHIYHK